MRIITSINVQKLLSQIIKNFIWVLSFLGYNDYSIRSKSNYPLRVQSFTKQFMLSKDGQYIIAANDYHADYQDDSFFLRK